MKLTLRQRAEWDLDEAYAWYESRLPGLGESFLRAAHACFARIQQDPDLYATDHGRVHRARLHRFPYSVFYVIRADHIDVLCVYHARRKPRRFDL